MARKEPKKIAYKLKNKCGDHVEDGVTYLAGDTVMSTRKLDKIFHTKFVKVHPDDFETPDRKPNIPSNRAAKDKGKGGKSKSSPPKPKNSTKFGTNVTDEFPSAVEAQLTVYMKDYWYQIVDRNTEDGKPSVVNEKKLQSKQVGPFLEKFVEKAEDIDFDDDDEDDEDE